MRKQHKIISARPFAFHDRVPTEAPDILNGATVNEWLVDRYSAGVEAFGIHSLLVSGGYKLGGWFYRFNMNKYLYKQCGQWHEAYAPNRTLLRAAVFGRIETIIELEKVE